MQYMVINKDGYTIFTGDLAECVNYVYAHQDLPEDDPTFAYGLLDEAGNDVEC